MKCLRMTPVAFLECSSDLPSKHWGFILHFGWFLEKVFFDAFSWFSWEFEVLKWHKIVSKKHFESFRHVFGRFVNISSPWCVFLSENDASMKNEDMRNESCTMYGNDGNHDKYDVYQFIFLFFLWKLLQWWSIWWWWPHGYNVDKDYDDEDDGAPPTPGEGTPAPLWCVRACCPTITSSFLLGSQEPPMMALDCLRDQHTGFWANLREQRCPFLQDIQRCDPSAEPLGHNCGFRVWREPRVKGPT